MTNTTTTTMRILLRTFSIALGMCYLFAHYVVSNIFLFIPMSIVVSGLIIFYLGIGSAERNWIVLLVKSKIMK